MVGPHALGRYYVYLYEALDWINAAESRYVRNNSKYVRARIQVLFFNTRGGNCLYSSPYSWFYVHARPSNERKEVRKKKIWYIFTHCLRNEKAPFVRRYAPDIPGNAVTTHSSWRPSQVTKAKDNNHRFSIFKTLQVSSSRSNTMFPMCYRILPILGLLSAGQSCALQLKHWKERFQNVSWSVNTHKLIHGKHGYRCSYVYFSCW